MVTSERLSSRSIRVTSVKPAVLDGNRVPIRDGVLKTVLGKSVRITVHTGIRAGNRGVQ